MLKSNAILSAVMHGPISLGGKNKNSKKYFYCTFRSLVPEKRWIFTIGTHFIDIYIFG